MGVINWFAGQLSHTRPRACAAAMLRSIISAWRSTCVIAAPSCLSRTRSETRWRPCPSWRILDDSGADRPFREWRCRPPPRPGAKFLVSSHLRERPDRVLEHLRPISSPTSTTGRRIRATVGATARMGNRETGWPFPGRASPLVIRSGSGVEEMPRRAPAADKIAPRPLLVLVLYVEASDSADPSEAPAAGCSGFAAARAF